MFFLEDGEFDFFDFKVFFLFFFMDLGDILSKLENINIIYNVRKYII